MGTRLRIFIVTVLAAASLTCMAQTRWQQWRAAQLPPGITILRDVHYGDGARETFDVYAPANAHGAPVIFMVHGGAWRFGDKSARGVVQNKVAHWVPRGVIVVSVDYPMLPETPPLQQAREVGMALAAAQRDAPRWGGDPHKFVLMGHSAGAHLVALLGAEPSLATSQGALPWLGTVALDSAAYNVATLMQSRHLGLYDRAFGSDPAAWAAVSPIAQLHAGIAPFLAVCSSRRADSCSQAQAFAAKARALGTQVEVLPEDLSHEEINATLGEPFAYTATVDRFLAGLDPVLAMQLR
ncbi:MAG: Esterase/lipase-like [Rhodanobacteraceae bacterium]|jgi:acetyl esterase/lipase|nr:MAG: Esterase/lipase-like [Rhodanobacteraceae bacterium]